jgi:tetratricopeptide (TPR) repeat protein
MNETAPTLGEVPESYVSARSLLHFMKGSLARDSGDDAFAIEQLKLAALYDALSPFPTYVLALEHFRQGQLPQAELTVRSALSLRPAHTPSLILLGRVSLQRGRVDDALNAFMEAISRSPTDPEPYGYLVDAYLAQDELASAIEAAQKFDALTAGRDARIPRTVRLRSVEALARVADALASRGQDEQAERFYRQAAEEPLTRAVQLKQLARFYQSRSRYRDAADTYLQAFSASRFEPMFTFEAARLYAQVGERKSVVACAEALAVTSLPEGRSAREAGEVAVAIGELLVREDDLEQAARVFSLSTRITPDWSLPFFRQGEALEKLGRLGEAASSFRKVSGHDALFASAQARAALCEHRNGARAQGFMMLKGLSKAYPGNPDVMCAFATAMELDGNAPGALTQLETIPPDQLTPTAASMLARLASRTGQSERAVKALRMAVARHPEDRPLAFELVNALDTLGLRNEAIVEARRLAADPHPFGAAMNYIARSLLASNTLDEALIFATRAVQSSPSNGAYVLTLGLIQSARGTSEALETLHRAAEMLPSNAEAQIRWAEAEAKACHRSEAIIGFTRALDAAGTSGDSARLEEAKRGLAGLSSTCTP